MNPPSPFGLWPSEFVIARLLAHSIVHFSPATQGVPGAAAGAFLNVSPDAPAPRNYGQETRDTLQAQVDLAPQQFAAQARFAPQTAQLNRQILADNLTGQNGLLDLYKNQIAPTFSSIQSADRQNQIGLDLDTIKRYSGDVTKSLRDASGNSKLIGLLNEQAMAELSAGSRLDPSMRREVQQGVRAGQQARGLGTGWADAAEEGMTTGQAGQALQRNRQQFATGVANLNQQTGGDPFMALLGRPSQTIGASQGAFGQGQGMNPGQMFNPESAYSQDVNNTNYNAKAAANIAGANNTASIIGGALSY